MSIQWEHENKSVDIVIIAGNRPEIIKVSELVKQLNDKYKSVFLYTGQHYSPNMRDVFFEDLDVQFDYDLVSNTSDVSTLTENNQKFLFNIHSKCRLTDTSKFSLGPWGYGSRLNRIQS